MPKPYTMSLMQEVLGFKGGSTDPNKVLGYLMYYILLQGKGNRKALVACISSTPAAVPFELVQGVGTQGYRI